MLTMMNQKGRLYTINHLHHPQHSQQPESLHINAAEYLVMYKPNACISAKDRDQMSSSASTLFTAAELEQTSFIAICAIIGQHSSNKYDHCKQHR